jgi:hypothetical protein
LTPPAASASNSKADILDFGDASGIASGALFSCETKVNNDFITVVIANLGVPIFFLAVEYAYRPDGTFVAVIQRSGPDLCLIGLGTSGSVFINPRVTSSFPVPSQLGLIILIVVILLLRRACYAVQADPPHWLKALVSLSLGIGSITLVFFVLMYGYVLNR